MRQSPDWISPSSVVYYCMKIQQLFSTIAAIGLLASAAPVFGGTCSHNPGFKEPYVSDVGATSSCQASLVSDYVGFDQLPPQVQSAIRSQCGNAAIDKIKIETKDGQTVYRVKFDSRTAWRMRPELVIASDGSVLKEKHMANVINEPAGSSLPDNR